MNFYFKKFSFSQTPLHTIFVILHITSQNIVVVEWQKNTTKWTKRYRISESSALGVISLYIKIAESTNRNSFFPTFRSSLIPYNRIFFYCHLLVIKRRIPSPYILGRILKGNYIHKFNASQPYIFHIGSYHSTITNFLKSALATTIYSKCTMESLFIKTVTTP